jgi:hypothetical protein
LKTPNLATICTGTTVSATFTAGSGGTGCGDDYTVSIDGGAAVAYTPGSSVAVLQQQASRSKEEEQIVHQAQDVLAQVMQHWQAGQ